MMNDEEEDKKLISDNIDKTHNTSLSICTRFTAVLKSRLFWKSLLLGQLISILLCGTGVTSGLLARRNIHIPTAQNFINYVLLCLTFTTRLAYRRTKRNITLCLKTWWWKYILLSVADVEANYLMVKAYSYTTVTSVQLLDCFTIIGVLVLSIVCLRVRYKTIHYIGVVICVLGLGGLVLTDFLSGNSKNTPKAVNKGLGDILCITGATLYSVSNVAEEYVVKHYDRTEFLGMLGLFGSFINGIQFLILERDEFSTLTTWSIEDVLLVLGFTACQFLLYTCMTIVIQQTSAATVNISILSADFYTLLFGLFIFKYQFHVLYFVCFGVIILGVGTYASRPTETRDCDTKQKLVNQNCDT